MDQGTWILEYEQGTHNESILKQSNATVQLY